MKSKNMGTKIGLGRHERCENCKYFSVRSGLNDYFGIDGPCMRFPQQTMKKQTSWCGEWKFRPGKGVSSNDNRT